jgi:hypothetical protein
LRSWVSKTRRAWGSTKAARQIATQRQAGRISSFSILPSAFPFSGVVADKQCTCPASKLMWERYPPTPLFHKQ